MKIGDEIKNWKDYLARKFSDNSLYQVFDNSDKLSEGIYRVKSRTNETVIDFIWPDKEWTTLDDIQYLNESAKGWSGELLGGNGPKLGVFNQKNIDYIEKVLEAPIRNGWISEEYYLNGKLFKAITYENSNGNKGAKIYTDFNTSCLGFVLFPFTLILNAALNLGLTGKRRIVMIEPIEKEQRNANKTYSA